jgi:serine/threonine protein kinase
MAEPSSQDDGVLALSLAQRVNEACDRFERAWKEGRRPAIEDYLAEASAPERAALLRELVPLEADYRRRRGEEPGPEDYRTRFPDLDADWLAHALAATPAPKEAGTPGPQGAHAPGATGLAEGPGTRIGPYKLLQQVGEGGMGAVWMAEQEQPVRRQVALKIIKPGLDSAQVIARFEAERQALALMDHPHIAKVLDAGTTEAGRPFFVMELVKGVPLTRFCDERRLTPRQRVELVIAVCQAVQHAHQKGIIHRDLKPSNILVAVYDGLPVPKVIDFGVAKATGPKLTEHTLFTAFGAVVGTLDYMAPEQAEVNHLDADTRADIYSLGVILYELLTGSTPLQRGRLKKVALMEVLRLIREQEPPKPSARLSTSETLPNVAALRGTEPAKLTRAVRGELDWIVMKCLEKDRERRYETANGLARDLQRYLADEPVQAGPPSAAYRLRKLAMRHRAALTATAAFGLVLAGASAVSMWLAARALRAEAAALQERDDKEQARLLALGNEQKALRAEQEAKSQAAKFEAVSFFLQRDLLLQADSVAQAEAGFTADPNLTVRAALDRAAAKVGERFRDQPVQEAAVRHAIGYAYQGLGEAQRAVPHLERAWALFGEQLGPEHSDALGAMDSLAEAYQGAGRLDQAVPLWEQLLARMRACFGPDHAQTLAVMANLASAYQDAGRLDRAVPLFEQVVATERNQLGPNSPARLSAMHNLASAYLATAQPHRAVPLCEQVLRVRREQLGPDHPSTLSSMNLLAMAYDHSGDPLRTVPLYEQLLAKCKERLGADHPHTLVTLTNLATAYKHVGRVAEAIPLYEQACDAFVKKAGADHPSTLAVRHNLATAYWAAGRTAETIALFEQVHGARRKQLGADHPDTLDTLGSLGIAYRDVGKPEQAVPLLREAATGFARRQFAHRNAVRCIEALCDCHEQLHQDDQAEGWRRQLLAEVKAQAGPTSAAYAGALVALGRCLLHEHKYPEAEQPLREALGLAVKTEPDAWTTFHAESLLGRALLGQQKYVEAAPLLTQGYEGLKQRAAQIPPPAKIRVTETLECLVQLYEAWGKPDEAKKWRAELEKLPKPPEPPKAR